MQNRYHPLVEPSPNCSFSIPTAICLCNVYRYSSSLQKFISTFFLPIQERSFLTPHFSLLISLLKRNNFPIFPLEAIQQKLTKTALFYCYIQNNFLLIYNTETQKISTLSYLYILVLSLVELECKKSSTGSFRDQLTPLNYIQLRSELNHGCLGLFGAVTIRRWREAEKERLILICHRSTLQQYASVTFKMALKYSKLREFPCS